MDSNLSLRPLKVKHLLTFIILISVQGISAQTLTKTASINLTTPPQTVSIDRQGHFYVASQRGDIDKYDKAGNLLYHFSPSKNGNVTLIEAWQGLRVFCYYQDFQQYLFLDRFLNSSELYRLPSQVNSFSLLVTLSGDDNLWLIDAQNLSLKKIDLPTNEMIIDTPLNLNVPSSEYHFSHMREYQNRLFISDPGQGVLVFDRFGNFTELMELKGINYFSFLQNELYYLKGNKVMFVDVYNQNKKEIELADLSYQFVLMENSLVICFANDKIDIYQIN